MVYTITRNEAFLGAYNQKLSLPFHGRIPSLQGRALFGMYTCWNCLWINWMTYFNCDVIVTVCRDGAIVACLEIFCYLGYGIPLVGSLFQ